MFPTIQSWKRGELAPQEYHTFRDGLWHPVEARESTIPAAGATAPRSLQFAVLSWNIDFMRPEDDARMASALKHLRGLVAGKPVPSVIMLNEMTKSDLNLIKQAAWVREGYNITDANTDHWESASYGTCMLLPRTLPLTTISRLHYPNTSMARDGLFADVALPGGRALRLCTTHLESLRVDPPRRPAQLAAAALHLRQAHAGILGGDLNAIQEFDEGLPGECGLRDAYLEGGGREGDEEGMTWGYQSGSGQRERYGLGRLDKILFCGGALKLLAFERFGMGVLVEDEGAASRLVYGDLEKAWVTDHLGVRAEFRVEVPEEKEGAAEVQDGETPIVEETPAQVKTREEGSETKAEKSPDTQEPAPSTSS
ncbi:Endonuclease/exonuclease/phosphatase [Chaetomium fimeti]|uniref:Endonuclease/exonuclease/phosphatase n=1 Tax=Chaetomium fimeti TaxID=1854472 RepID=A0AAE0HJJ0_9PEZI|nr:Endonuclease/exonuclease/phosphatase [Chaetomium fimeti]